MARNKIQVDINNGILCQLDFFDYVKKENNGKCMGWSLESKEEEQLGRVTDRMIQVTTSHLGQKWEKIVDVSFIILLKSFELGER